MAVLHIKTDDGREVEISRGSHIYARQDGQDQVYWEWEKIPGSHDALNEILAMNKEILQKVDKVLPEIPKNALK
jgi:hypothetical protein